MVDDLMHALPHRDEPEWEARPFGDRGAWGVYRKDSRLPTVTYFFADAHPERHPDPEGAAHKEADNLNGMSIDYMGMWWASERERSEARAEVERWREYLETAFDQRDTALAEVGRLTAKCEALGSERSHRWQAMTNAIERLEAEGDEALAQVDELEVTVSKWMAHAQQADAIADGLNDEVARWRQVAVDAGIQPPTATPLAWLVEELRDRVVRRGELLNKATRERNEANAQAAHYREALERVANAVGAPDWSLRDVAREALGRLIGGNSE